MNTIAMRRCRGQVLIMVALAAVVLLGFAGLAIDSGFGYGVKAKLNAAVDAAAIAAARAVVEGENDTVRRDAAIAAGTKYFHANFPDGYMGATPGAPTVSATHDLDPASPTFGRWNIAVDAAATRSTYLMRLLGIDTMTVSAAGEAVRRDLDMVLVIDTSGSLAPPTSPSTTFPKVKAAAVSFVNKFMAGPGGDRIGLVAFASGAEVRVAINKDATRGFDRTAVTNAINALPVSGSTASAEAMRRALVELDAVPETYRSSLRVIVFFSDGAPNDVNATYPCSIGRQSTTGDLYSDTTVPPLQANALYDAGRINAPPLSLQSCGSIVSLPATGVGGLALASYPGHPYPRTLSGTPYENTRCNVNKAARNMVETLANTARADDIWVYTLGLGVRLNSLEPDFPGCYQVPAREYGANILRRLANAQGVDTFNANQPRGLYVFAENADELDAAFTTIASEILRLSR